jgi:hypothetical protein
VNSFNLIKEIEDDARHQQDVLYFHCKDGTRYLWPEDQAHAKICTFYSESEKLWVAIHVAYFIGPCFGKGANEAEAVLKLSLNMKYIEDIERSKMWVDDAS